MPKSKSRKKKPPKRVLALPDLEHTKTAVLNSLSSASGQRTYDHAIDEFVRWYCSEPRLACNRTDATSGPRRPSDRRFSSNRFGNSGIRMANGNIRIAGDCWGTRALPPTILTE